jgi:hypothetical protein
MISNEERRAYATSVCISVRSRSDDHELPRFKHVYRLEIVEGELLVVCHGFWTDVFQVANEFLARAMTMPLLHLSNRADPKSQSVHEWLEQMQVLYEFQPDAVGAGRTSAADGIAPSKRKTGVMLPFAHKRDVYDEYKDEMGQGGETASLACSSLFMRIWREQFPHIKLRKHSRFAKCDDCVRLRELLRTPTQEDRRNARRDSKYDNPAMTEFRLHLQDIKNERRYYHQKRRHAKEFPEDVLSIILDGADQGSYGQCAAVLQFVRALAMSCAHARSLCPAVGCMWRLPAF